MTTRHPGSRRTHTPAIEPDDAIIAKVAEASVWTRNNSRVVIIGVVVLGIGIFTAVEIAKYRTGIRERASSELLEVRETAATGNIPTAVTALDAFVDRYDGTPSAAEARLLLAQLQLAQGNPSQAIEAVRPLAESRDNLAATSAGLLLAGAHEAAGEPAEAERVYIRVAATAEMEFQKREALEDAARIRVERGDIDGAVALYDELIALTEDNSPDRDVYEMRRTEVITARGTPAPAANPGS